MKTENLAIEFVDIKGFTTRTSAQSREENQKLLRRFAAVVRPVTAAFNGRIVKNIGDAHLLTFRSPTDALHCAMAMQDRLAESNGKVPGEERFEVRVAVNVGEVRVESGDVFGEAVNIASRIESLADGGEIYFSEAVYLVMNKSEVPYEEVGRRELKGIPESVKIYRVPRVKEVGDYRVQGSGRSTGASTGHPLEPPALPFGGRALERVRSRLPDPLAEDGALPDASESLREAGAKAQTLWRAFFYRFQTDSNFRYVVLVVGAALIALLLWALLHRRPESRGEKFRNAVKGFFSEAPASPASGPSAVPEFSFRA